MEVLHIQSDSVLVVSDLHLGSGWNPGYEFTDAVDNLVPTTDVVVFLGDFVDVDEGLHLSVPDVFTLRWVVMPRFPKEIIMVRGNHDSKVMLQMSRILPQLRVCDSLVVKSGDKSILMMHGHQFDKFIRKHPKTADVVEAVGNKLPIIRYIGQRVVSMFSSIASTERSAAMKLLKDPKYDMVVLGHSHVPSVEGVIPGKTYVNAGSQILPKGERTIVLIRHGKAKEVKY